jgi:hypothetical protein
MAALLEGARKGVSLQLSFRDAVRFRQRLYQLRNSMRLESHPEYRIVSRVKVTITWPEDANTIRTSKDVHFPSDRKTICRVDVKPLDSEFDAALATVGITPSGPTVPQAAQDLDKFLETLTKDSQP